MAIPAPLNELKPGKYTIQAVFRVNPDTHRIGDGEGNAYGPMIQTELDPKSERAGFRSPSTGWSQPRKFPSTDRIKLVELESPILSEFHHRPIKHRAAVILPAQMPEGDGKLPVLYIIPGFGGDHFMAARWSGPRTDFAGDFIRVILDPDCGTGHHVFADSATNGPRGKALVEELIPHIERTFPGDRRAARPALERPLLRRLEQPLAPGDLSRFFRRHLVDQPRPGRFSRLSTDQHLSARRKHVPGAGRARCRPIARMGNTPALFYDKFSQMDDVIGWGGQLGSFEAVFSPLDQSGRPRKLWDRSTGRDRSRRGQGLGSL